MELLPMLLFALAALGLAWAALKPDRIPRFDVSKWGIFVRIGRWYVGLIPAWPILAAVPVIAGGVETSQGMPAQGTYLMMGDGASPEGFQELSEVTSIGGPSISRERLDFTHLRTIGNFRIFKASFTDPGTMTVRIQYIPTDSTHQALQAKLSVADPTNFRLVFPDANGWDFSANVTGFNLTGLQVGGKIEVDVTLSLSGLVDFSGTGSPTSP